MDRYNYHNYDEYRDAQIMANKKKLDRNWSSEEEMKYLGDWLKKNRSVRSGICHGSRNGKEAQWLAKHTGGEIIAADISPTIKNFGGIQWDFHQKNPDWVGKFDVVYCNSLDHAYDASQAIDAFLESLSDSGVLIIQWTPCGHRDFYPNKVDCFAANLKEYKAMCGQAGNLIDTLKTKEIRKHDNILFYHLLIGRSMNVQSEAPVFKML